jgi:hypothetical protein
VEQFEVGDSMTSRKTAVTRRNPPPDPLRKKRNPLTAVLEEFLEAEI